MSRGRAPLGPTLVLGAVAAATTWAALTSWRGFVLEPSAYLQALLVVALLVGVGGALLRATGVPSWLVVLVQATATIGVVSFQVTGSPLPIGAASAELTESLRLAVETSRLYAAPISPKAPPVWPLLLAGGAVFVLLVDILACTFRQVPGAGLALLAIYSVPSGLLEDGPGWGSFLAAAVGFLALLQLDTREQLLRWGRPLGPADGSPWREDNPVREAVRAGAGRIGVTATALALVLPAFVPVLDVDLFELGTGSGGGDIRIRKPIADMRRDLDPHRPDPTMVRLRTDDPRPEYLRISVLNRFTGNEWSSGDRDVASDNIANGPLPDPAGLSQDVPRREYSYDVEITDELDSTWLPTQFPASAVVADGDWRFDPTTLDVLAADDDLDTQGMDYEMTGVALQYGTSGEFFRDAPAGSVSTEVQELPPDLPQIVEDLARDVTEAVSNDYERALLLQRWFRQTGGFEYSLEKAPVGTGNETLASFLAEDGRVGYCEQYASAMAVMARAVGIPARVAIGFLSPERTGEGRWEYSAHDLHAWPELYFAGAGWVRFEPTPSGRAPSVPPYSRVRVDAPDQDPAVNPSDQQSAGDGATAVAPDRPTAPPTDQAGAPADGSGQGRGLGTTILLVLGAVVLLLGLGALLLLGPRAVRERTRRTRLTGGPDEAWAELHATARDLGVSWPEGRSPREIGTTLVQHLADPADLDSERPRTGADVAPRAADALERLVMQVEWSRYARPGSVATLERTDLRGDTQLVITALEAGVVPRVRQRAQWFPRSLWRS